jgi:hypothetical protein
MSTTIQPGAAVTTFTGRRGTVECLLPDRGRRGHDRILVRIACGVVGARDRGETIAVSCIYRLRDVWTDTGVVPF